MMSVLGNIGLNTYHTQHDHIYQYYQGEWRLRKMHGYGKLAMRDGSVYEGGFKSGLPEGKGRIMYANSDILNGYFKEGKIHGHA